MMTTSLRRNLKIQQQLVGGEQVLLPRRERRGSQMSMALTLKMMEVQLKNSQQSAVQSFDIANLVTRAAAFPVMRKQGQSAADG